MNKMNSSLYPEEIPGFRSKFWKKWEELGVRIVAGCIFVLSHVENLLNLET